MEERESKREEEKGDLMAEMIKWKKMNEKLKESFDWINSWPVIFEVM